METCTDSSLTPTSTSSTSPTIKTLTFNRITRLQKEFMLILSRQHLTPPLPFYGPQNSLYAPRIRVLTEEEETAVNDALAYNREEVVLVDHPPASIKISRAYMSRLRPREWMNDELINLYLHLLLEKHARTCAAASTPIKLHYFNTHFTTLFTNGYEYKKLKRWSRNAQVRILDLHKVQHSSFCMLSYFTMSFCLNPSSSDLHRSLFQSTYLVIGVWQ
jgi:hypothetical protein